MEQGKLPSNVYVYFPVIRTCSFMSLFLDSVFQKLKLSEYSQNIEALAAILTAQAVCFYHVDSYLH